MNSNISKTTYFKKSLQDVATCVVNALDDSTAMVKLSEGHGKAVNKVKLSECTATNESGEFPQNVRRKRLFCFEYKCNAL